MHGDLALANGSELRSSSVDSACDKIDSLSPLVDPHRAGGPRATLAHKYGCDDAVIWLRMDSREARSLGAVHMGGRRVQEPAQP